MLRILSFHDAMLWGDPDGGDGGGGIGSALGSSTASTNTPSVTSYGPNESGGWSVTNSSGATTTWDGAGNQTVSYGAPSGGKESSGTSTVAAAPQQTTPVPPAATKTATTTAKAVTETKAYTNPTITDKMQVPTTAKLSDDKTYYDEFGDVISERESAQAYNAANAAIEADKAAKSEAATAAGAPLGTQGGQASAEQASGGFGLSGALAAGKASSQETASTQDKAAPASTSTTSSQTQQDLTDTYTPYADLHSNFDPNTGLPNPRGDTAKAEEPSDTSRSADGIDVLGDDKAGTGISAALGSNTQTTTSNTSTSDLEPGWSRNDSRSLFSDLAGTEPEQAFDAKAGLTQDSLSSDRSMTQSPGMFAPTAMRDGMSGSNTANSIAREAAATARGAPSTTLDTAESVYDAIGTTGRDISNSYSVRSNGLGQYANPAEGLSLPEDPDMPSTTGGTLQPRGVETTTERTEQKASSRYNEDQQTAIDNFLATVREEVRGSRDPYNTVVGGKIADITGMTIAEAMEYATKNGAIGAYQFTEKNTNTLSSIANKLGFDIESTYMTPEVQDALALGLAQQRADWAAKTGEFTIDSFAHQLAGEWAAFESPVTGKGIYDGDKWGNQAYVDSSRVVEAAQALVDAGVITTDGSATYSSDSNIGKTPGTTSATSTTDDPAGKTADTTQASKSSSEFSRTDESYRAEREANNAAAYDRELDAAIASNRSPEAAASRAAQGKSFLGDTMTVEQYDALPNGALQDQGFGAKFNADGTVTVVNDPSIPGGSTAQHKAMQAIGGLGDLLSGGGSSGSGTNNDKYASDAGGNDQASYENPPPVESAVSEDVGTEEYIYAYTQGFIDDYLRPTPGQKWDRDKWFARA